jgi:hypothetical protein
MNRNLWVIQPVEVEVDPAVTTASLTALPNPKSLGAALERQRLEHRARRLQRVLTALEDRYLYRDATPPALREAIHGFRTELDAVERRLELLAD